MGDEDELDELRPTLKVEEEELIGNFPLGKESAENGVDLPKESDLSNLLPKKRVAWPSVLRKAVSKNGNNTETKPTYELDDGGEYTGEIKHCDSGKIVIHGLGKLVFGENNSLRRGDNDDFLALWCAGQFVNGKLNGNGILVSKCGVYTGSFVDGEMSGMGTFKNTIDGSKMAGTFEDGIPHGYATCTFSNGDSFSGKFENGIPDSRGHYKSAEGVNYKGDITAVGASGFGILESSENDFRYTGEFRNNAPHGHGLRQHYSGEVYKGSMKEGSVDGPGILVFANKDACVGVFKDGVLDGKGEFDFSNGDYYVGDFKDGVMHGEGTLFWKKANESYKGEFVNGNINGSGELMRGTARADQRKLFAMRGNFAHGKPEGEVVFESTSRKPMNAIYVDGVLQKDES